MSDDEGTRSACLDGEGRTLIDGGRLGAPVMPSRLGPYIIVREIGRGGMGVVYLARQSGPVERMVAIKVIACSEEGTAARAAYVTRFHAECRTLSRLQHPNIARVYDAGSADNGDPYLVMELLEGEPLTDYCDRRRLSLADRVQLMAQVCRGVHFAHQKGVIHRDLKPSNILVVDEGDDWVPKLIDFGVAKEMAVEDGITVHGEILGSPSYMSPEQLQHGASEVDVRSDVYSLGVVLYELLVGDPPYRRCGDSLYRFLQRVVNEPMQSLQQRFMGLGDRQAAVARSRGSSAVALERQLSRELGWVTERALAKERSDRYGSAEKLAEDLERFLRREPLSAGPRTLGYRVRALARRHRRMAAAVSVTVLALAVAVVVSTVSAVRAGRSEARAVASAERAVALNTLLEELLTSVDPRHDGPNVRVRELLDRRVRTLAADLDGQPDLEVRIRTVLGTTYAALGEYDLAEEQLQMALALAVRTLGGPDPKTLAVRDALAHLWTRAGRIEAAVALSRETVELRRAAAGDGLLASELVLADALYRQGEYEEAESLYSAVAEQRAERLGEHHLETLVPRVGQARALRRLGELDESQGWLQEVLERRRSQLGMEHPDTLEATSALGHLLFLKGQFDQAEPLYRRTLETARVVFGPEHPATLLAANNLGNILYKMGRLQAAEALYRETVAIQRRTLGPDHPDTLLTCNNLANALRRQERYEDAEPVYRQTLAAQRRVPGPAHDETIRTALNYATVLLEMERARDAVEVLDNGIAVRPEIPDLHVRRARALAMLGRNSEARAELAALREQWSSDAKLHLEAALTLLMLDDTDAALEAYGTVVDEIRDLAFLQRYAIGPVRRASGLQPQAKAAVLALLESVQE